MAAEQLRPCDNTSVGVIITDTANRYLLIDRATPPYGMAPVAGHIDHHGSPEATAGNEVAEEVGLHVTQLRKLSETWRPNTCRRPPGPEGTGHHWTLFHATAHGALQTDPREVRTAQWVTGEQLQALAERTADYARGDVTAAEFLTTPGLQPVWQRFLVAHRLIITSDTDLTAIDTLT
jgi:ADP-ribose pyrophosphatase YjhB (NUDIX family)